MRKRKQQIERSETLIPNPERLQTHQSKQDDEEVAEEGKGFFACYLLCSLCPRFKGQTYIGFTVNPCRRIRQHNGELRSGAWRTKSKRPWEMILCIYGFPTNVMALQFEWAWQHPTESLAVRKAAASLKSLSGIAGKIKIAYTMLTLPPWESLKLTVNFFSTKYMKEAVGCKIPKQMKVQYCPMEELPCYTGCEQSFDEIADEDSEDEDAQNGTNQRHSEGPTNTSANNLSDFYGCNVETDFLNLKKNEVSRPEDPSFQSLEDNMFALVRNSQPKQAYSSLGEDHRQAFHPVNSPDMSPFRGTNLVNSVPTVEDRGPSTLIEKNQLDEAYSSRQPFNLDDSPVVSSFRSNNLINPVEIVEDRDPFALIRGNLPEDRYASRAVDHRQSIHLIDSPVLSTFRKTNVASLVEPVEDNDPLGLIERRGNPFGGEIKQNVSSTIAVEQHQLSNASGLHSPEFSSDSTCAEEDSSIVKMSFSKNSGLTKMAEDKDYSGLVQESEMISPQKCAETPSFADDKQSLPTEGHLAPHQVEVIDISTPSSIDMFRGFRKKKKRNNWVSQDVIDLTKSPIEL